MRISDWSSDVCSSDLPHVAREQRIAAQREQAARGVLFGDAPVDRQAAAEPGGYLLVEDHRRRAPRPFIDDEADRVGPDVDDGGSMRQKDRKSTRLNSSH